MVRIAFTLALLALVASSASAARVLLQTPPPPVSAQELTNALSKINKYAQVPDISQSVANTPDYANKVAQAQGPAQEVVLVANELTAPTPSPNAPALQAALRAYGYQQGKSALAPVGQKLYDAYTGLTNALNYKQ